MSGRPNTIMRHFDCSRDPKDRYEVSKPISEIASYMDRLLTDGPEKSAGLRKLLEAQDCFLRAHSETITPDDRPLTLEQIERMVYSAWDRAEQIEEEIYQLDGSADQRGPRGDRGLIYMPTVEVAIQCLQSVCTVIDALIAKRANYLTQEQAQANRDSLIREMARTRGITIPE